MNDYDELSAVYQLTDQKPDKKYAMTATANLMLGYFGDKKILDLGCGSGFFTRQFADKNPQIVIGIDNSIEQIQRAKTRPYPKTHYILGNALTDKLPNSDIVSAHF